MTDLRSTIAETGIATSTTRGRSPTRAWCLRIVSGPAQIRSNAERSTVGSKRTVIGAGADCDVMLTDPKVSAQHTEVRAAKGGLAVRDLDSTNGTFIDGVRVTEAVLAEGAQLQCGDTKLELAGGEVPMVPPSSRMRFGGLAGTSRAMREVFAILELASPTDSTVLLQGESGTGKELAARAIHDHSLRAGRPFVVVDCSATNSALIESQLFGHRKGAFTGATHDREGAFVRASGGTVFLDEIGELPLELQSRLLRVLESRTVHPVGSDEEVRVDPRIVAATNRDLDAMVAESTFRFDLYYRLAVIHVLIPALRARLDDLPELVHYFYEGRNAEPGPIEGASLLRLQRHRWPGNVRELRNILERSWVLSGGVLPFSQVELYFEPIEFASPRDRAPVDSTLPFKTAKERWIALFEERYLADVFERFESNISRTAEHAGLDRHHLSKLLRKHGILKR